MSDVPFDGKSEPKDDFEDFVLIFNFWFFVDDGCDCELVLLIDGNFGGSLHSELPPLLPLDVEENALIRLSD